MEEVVRINYVEEKAAIEALPYIEEYLPNRMIAPSEVVSEKEFFDYFVLYTPTLLSFQQIQNFEGSARHNARTVFFHDRAFTIITLPDKVEVYRVGCIHLYSSTGIGRGYHELKCTKCGQTLRVDSSD